MRPSLVLAASLLAMGCSAAVADDRPSRYDMDSHCSRLANSNEGFSPEVMQKCLLAQSDALDQIKRVWSDTPDYIQHDCDLRGRAGGEGDYVLLQKCIRDQTRQATPDVVLPAVP